MAYFDDDEISVPVELVDSTAALSAYRRVRTKLRELAEVRLTPQARQVVRYLYGIIGDDTALGRHISVRELQELEAELKLKEH